MERTMRRFKEAMSMPPSFIIETKTKQRKRRRRRKRSTTKSFSIGCGEFQTTRLFRRNIVTLKESNTNNNCNANSATLLAKGTLNDKQLSLGGEKENKKLLTRPTSSSSFSLFDLVLDESADCCNHSIHHHDDNKRNASFKIVDEIVSDDDDDSCFHSEDDDDDLLGYESDSDISSIGMPGDFYVTTKPRIPKTSSRLLLAAAFPKSPTGGAAEASAASASASTSTITNTAPTTKNTNGIPPQLDRNELHLWKTTTTTTTTTKNNSTDKLARARSLTALGHLHLQQQQGKEDYGAARMVLKEACQLYESIHGPNHTSVALALDTFGLACCHTKHHVQQGLEALQRAFQIRCHHLGVWHVDTVDTYNKIAGIYLQMGLYQKALVHYQEVLKVRRAMLGPQHPSVAITAHALAKVHFALGNFGQAKTQIALAKEIYSQLGMRYNHKAMASLLKDEQNYFVAAAAAAANNNKKNGNGSTTTTQEWPPETMIAEF